MFSPVRVVVLFFGGAAVVAVEVGAVREGGAALLLAVDDVDVVEEGREDGGTPEFFFEERVEVMLGTMVSMDVAAHLVCNDVSREVSRLDEEASVLTVGWYLWWLEIVVIIGHGDQDSL